MNLVSVVIPVFNAERYLREAIDSVLAQEGVNVEIIAIDDGSTDGSPDILATYEGRIVCRRQTNSGQAMAMNEALKLATGEYVAYLDADDVCLPDRLSAQVRYLQSYPHIDLVYTATEYIEADGRSMGVKRVNPPDPLRLLFLNDVPHSTVMHRRAALDRVGVFDASYLNHDWDLWVRFSESSRLGFIPTPLVRYRVHPTNVSRTRRRALNHHRWARMIMLGKTWERRGRPCWLRLLYERARIEWWLLTHPVVSERAGLLWWYTHVFFNAIEMHLVRWIVREAAYPKPWREPS